MEKMSRVYVFMFSVCLFIIHVRELRGRKGKERRGRKRRRWREGKKEEKGGGEIGVKVIERK